MSLREAGLVRWKPDQEFALKPENSADFCNQIKAAGQQLCFLGMISRVPTECDIDPADANNITYRERKDMLETYGVVTDDHVQKLATMTWGDKSYTITADKEIQDPSHARQEMTLAGAALTNPGKKLLLTRFQNEMLGNCVLKSFDIAGRKAIMLEKDKFQWFHPTSGELVNDGPVILQIALHKLRPNVLLIAFNEIKKVKSILPAKFGHKIDEWDTAMEAARVDIETKLPGEYTEKAFINDYFNGALSTPVKSFKTDVTSMKQRWQLGSPMTMNFVRTTICQMYMNFNADENDIWATELAEVNQIIALATKLEDLEFQLKKTTVALATATTDGGRRSQRQRQNSGKNSWMITKEGNTKEMYGKTYTWCDEDHWFNGEKVNGIYHTHTKGDHVAWKKRSDEAYANRKKNNQTTGSDTAVNDATKKKLSLSEKLRTAMTTQAGLSQEAFTRIWAECDGDSSKD